MSDVEILVKEDFDRNWESFLDKMREDFQDEIESTYMRGYCKGLSDGRTENIESVKDLIQSLVNIIDTSKFTQEQNVVFHRALNFLSNN